MPVADHRPWPLPERSWSWRQTCRDVLSLHWPVPGAVLRPRIPRALELEELGGSAWISVIALRIAALAGRRWRAVPGFPQLNVRTYVRHGARAGVWFFSLDAGSRIAAWVAHRLFHLPYVHTAMRVRHAGIRLEYRAVRASGATFEAAYAPAGATAAAEPGTPQQWLMERYCLYAERRSGELYRAEIDHAPWPLALADCDLRRNDMLRTLGLPIAGPAPHAYCSPGLDILAWSPERVADV